MREENMKSRNKSFSGIQEMGKEGVENLNLKSWKSGEGKKSSLER